ncbi:MAG: DUF3160 domain-containing protein [Melioribacteraceae bacterium]|nr:DUF3160 domain-containing protein [Melioribacteraceae bacterium]
MKFKIAVLLFLFAINLTSQTSLDLDSYKSFLQQNKDLTYAQLTDSYNAGIFKSNLNRSWTDALYSDSIEIKYGLTSEERLLLNNNGFVVTERLAKNSFGEQLADIFHKDLPVFITSDAIIHAVHRSYDEILKQMELSLLIPKVKNFIERLQSQITLFGNRYTLSPEIERGLRDLDLYLSVPLKLFDDNYTAVYNQNSEEIKKILELIYNEEYAEINFLSSIPRKIDFSQFKPRGHYADTYYRELEEYFRVMIWFGKMELYLISPNAKDPPALSDVRRQAFSSLLLKELIEFCELTAEYNEINEMIELFVGEQDNVTISNLADVMQKSGLTSSQQILDSLNFELFQNILRNQSYADQRILSQVLIINPFSAEDIKPASSFLLFGQRFVIDSYITGSVVYDKINYNGIKIKRMLPSTLDVLFALGNDAALQLLQDELEQYKYASNLAALRYLIDQYKDEFWNSTIYNNWLNAIRSLNPPQNREQLPQFMQSAAWWQKTMNTQLASWTELRHDNLLYAKQSYTGGAVCSYPYSYVEPVPEFYSSVEQLANSAYDKIISIDFGDDYRKQDILNYFTHLSGVADTLGNIAIKQLNETGLTEDEISFLKSMLSESFSCVPDYQGWYTRLYYPMYSGGETMLNKDRLVADYHTAPTDAGGGMVGWVKHSGTGDIDLMIIAAGLPSGEYVAFAGPVSSYHEYTTTNFYRITDEEWNENYLPAASRPEWVNIYMADKEGNSYGTGISLITSVKNGKNQEHLPAEIFLSQNYPNPFNPSTIISYTIPSGAANRNVKLSVYDISGELIKELVNNVLPSGNYLTEWDGTNTAGLKVSSGIYFYSLNVGAERLIGKMNLIK